MRQVLSLLITLLLAENAFATSDVIIHWQQRQPKDQGEERRDPDPEPNLDGVVEVSFRLDNMGKVQILNINSTSPQLSDYVIKKLSKIQLDNSNSEVGKIIKYRFVFKKQA